MSSTNYPKAYSAFTGLTPPYTKPDSTRLESEIRSSSIIVALDFIDTDDGTSVCDIWFKDVLSQDDQDTLDGIVAAHTGAPFIVVVPTPVKLVENNLLDPDSSLSKTYTHDVTIKGGQDVTEHDISYPYEIDAAAARYFIAAETTGPQAGDRFDIIGIPGGDPPVGYVTVDTAQGETVIPVSSTVFEYLRHGLYTEFASHHRYYEIISVDEQAGTITLTEGLEQAITVGDTLHIRRELMGNMRVEKGVLMPLGDLSSGSSGLCANAKLRIVYRPVSQPASDFVLGFQLIYYF